MKYIIVLLSLFSLLACQPAKEKKMTLTLRLAAAAPAGNWCKILAFGDSFDGPTQYFSFAEGQTEHVFEILAEAPEIMGIVYSEPGTDTFGRYFSNNFYVEQGGKLTVTLRKEEGNENTFAYAYEGSAAVYMQLLDSLAKSEAVFQERYLDERNGHYSLKWEDFHKEVNEMMQHQEALIAHAEGLSDDFKTIMKAELFAKRMSHIMVYEGTFNSLKEEGTEDFVAPGIEDRYEKAFAFDEVATGSPSFRHLIGEYDTEERTERTRPQSLKERFEKRYEWLKTNEHIPEIFRPYMLADYIRQLPDKLGIDEARHFKEDFVKAYPKAASVKKVRADYAKWELLIKGHLAPDFEYESLEGKPVSLSSLKGNVVYVDVWATWCRPCIAEFRDSKVLKERFKDAKDVKWLYVSIDNANAREKWKKAIAKHQLKGIHLFSGQGWNATIAKRYQIRGIPRYILVDKAGNIHNADAPAPSSGEVIYNEIQKLREAG